MPYPLISHHFPENSGTQMLYVLLFHCQISKRQQIANLSSSIQKIAQGK
ncbi:hypothetical protein KNP414_06389 [Paenibacillus mucilaginosus KNP414]|uniref:Uncharacterized protein n=1 Tax=Paenibacillus mucilaginosus (strain KNP414) TaxID=1036673 RepID=F8FMV0_PAEMK|nr:hypothetical protein KNP414_06389 [Paenibacillus mucilaginosus KNP414]